MRLPIYRNHYANHTEYVMLVRKGMAKRLIGAVVAFACGAAVAVVCLLTIYFLI